MKNSLIMVAEHRPITKIDLIFRLIELSESRQDEKCTKLNTYINSLIKEEKTTRVYISELRTELDASLF